MRTTKKIAGFLLILSLVLSFGMITASADPDPENPAPGEGGSTTTPTTGTEGRYEGDQGGLTDILGETMTFDKYLVLNKKADVPDVKFKFTIEAGTDGDDKGEQVFIKPVDMNDASPAPAPKDSSAYTVIGKPVFTIPYLGYVANYIQNPPGTYIAVSLGALVMFLVFLPDLFDSGDRQKTQQKREKKSQPRNS